MLNFVANAEKNSLSFADAFAARGFAKSRSAGKRQTDSMHAVEALEFVSQILGRTAICCDNSNMHLSRPRNELGICHDKVTQYLGGEELVSATIAVTHAPFHSQKQDAFYQWLEISGWKVNAFSPLVSDSGVIVENEVAVDGNVVDQILTACHSGDVDSIVILSGDHAMADAIWEARRAGVDVYVIAWFGTMSATLKNAASNFAYVQDLLPLIGRTSH